MTAPKAERRQYDIEIIDKLTAAHEQLIVIDERQKLVLKRLDTINGTVADYNANKYKMDLACKDIVALEKDINDNIKPPLTKLTIKVYSAAILTGLFSGGIGALIGFYIAKLFAVAVGV